MAYQAYQLALQPYRYSSAEEVPVVHQNGSSRHCILVLVGSRNLKATTTRKSFWIGSLFSPVAASAASSSPSERKRERERDRHQASKRDRHWQQLHTLHPRTTLMLLNSFGRILCLSTVNRAAAKVWNKPSRLGQSTTFSGLQYPPWCMKPFPPATVGSAQKGTGEGVSALH